VVTHVASDIDCAIWSRSGIGGYRRRWRASNHVSLPPRSRRMD